MLDELQRRNYSQNTICTYMHAVEEFSRYFHRSPDRLGPDHIRQYQAYLFRERKLQAGTVACCTAALRFLYVKTLRHPYLPEHIPFPKRPRQLPVVLSPEEVQRVIDSAENLMRRAMVMTLYSTGIRCSDAANDPANLATLFQPVKRGIDGRAASEVQEVTWRERPPSTCPTDSIGNRIFNRLAHIESPLSAR
jgi:site-specific recombinase XerD